MVQKIVRKLGNGHLLMLIERTEKHLKELREEAERREIL